jgi:hypothetical protein
MVDIVMVMVVGEEADENVWAGEEQEKTTWEILDEVFDAIEQGYSKKVKLAAGRLYLYNELGESKVFDLRHLDTKTQRTVKQKAQEYAKKVREMARAIEAEESRGEEDRKPGEEKKRSGGERAGIGRRYTLEALDRSHAKIVRNITERVEWFADVLHEVGFYATLIAMQEAKVPPEELYDKILEFSNPGEFARFVKDHLVALLEAKDDAQKIIELKRRLEAMDLKLAILEEAIEEIKRQRDQATIALYAAVSTMDEEQLRQFVLNLMVAQYGLSVKLPNVPNSVNMNVVGGVEVGAGATNGEGVGEKEGNS